uniref:Chitin-binding type-2 domain-containing protein n=1 Tax=Megaselia scalaris TaxID=36166 RepID=T1GE91_MEGSC
MMDVLRTKLINKLWQLALTLGFFYLTAVLGNQSITSPVFQNHKTKEWTSLDNITFEFDCTKRPVGFYADMDYNCQIFHMCDEEGNRIPHLCANETSFNQEYRICDWDYNFNCTESPKWFYLNELTYATESPEDEDY